MKIIRYQSSPVFNSVRNYDALRGEMDRLFDVAFSRLGSLPEEGLQSDLRGEFPLDLYQNKDSFVVRAEIPGFRKEDLTVEVTENTLTITGHQKVEPASDGKEKEDGVLAQERQVTRSLSIPEQIRAEAIQAAYENGVLTVTLPRQEEVKPRQITVEVK